LVGNNESGDKMIRKATLKDIDQVENGYTELLLYEQEHQAYTVWQLGVYPTRKVAEDAFQNNELYVMDEDGDIYASVIVNQVQPQEYQQIHWKYDVLPHQVLVIHLLCVRPSKAGKGIGKKMVNFVIEEGKRLGCQTVRLDTGSQNKPAIALYEKMGFELVGKTKMAIGGKIAHNDHLFFEKKIG